jgi:hypothetical protein
MVASKNKKPFDEFNLQKGIKKLPFTIKMSEKRRLTGSVAKF